MKLTNTFLVFITLVAIKSCLWFEEDVIRTISCIQPGEYDYLEHDWIDSICTTEICSTYTEVWKELFIKRNNMTNEYFSEHITIINSSIFVFDGEGLEIGYRVQNDWAIAESWDRFVIKIGENNNDYPEIGLPKGTYLTLEQIEVAIDKH